MAHTSKRVPNATLDQIEKAIDRHGLEAILSAVAEICFLKAEHVASAWQDEPTSKAWERAGAAVDRCSGANAVRAVSL